MFNISYMIFNYIEIIYFFYSWIIIINSKECTNVGNM